jgi:hypothetical protein
MKRFLTLLICFPILLNSQTDGSLHLRMVEGLTRYRHELISHGFTILEERPIDGWSWVMFHCRAEK